MNAEGVIQSASESVETVFGWTPTELCGRNVKLLIPEPRRSSLDRYLDRYRHADRTKVLNRSRRFDALRKDGSVVHIELSMSRADLPSHGEPYFIGIIRDYSGQIDIVGDTPEARSRLQSLVTEQTRALATANLRLQLTDRLASLGTLAAGLGHDMNNVLLPVRARLNAIEHAGISASVLNHVKAVRRSVTYLQHLSDGLHFLALDPDGPGVASSEAGSTNLASWWRQVGVLLRRSVARRVSVEASFPASLPSVRSAPQWLTQAVLNLVVNASEASPEGRRGKIRISAVATADGKCVRLCVKDNGRGMSPEVRRRAFDLFFTTKQRGMGTGLGLPLVQKVAVRAGGHVEIKSEPGHGTVVTLVLATSERSLQRSGTAAPIAQTAAVSLPDHRTSALISQILVGAGVEVSSRARSDPGSAQIWITRPIKSALPLARAWKKRLPARTLVVVGQPPRTMRAEWASLGAVVIDPPDDFEAMRQAIGTATEPPSDPLPTKGRR